MEEAVPTLPAGSRTRPAEEPPTGALTGGVARTAVVVSLSHALVDAYAGFLPPLLPRIMDKLGLSIALAATLAMTFSLASSLLQPALGWIADHRGRRAFVVGGPLLSGIFLSLIGLAPSFTLLLALLCVAGLGSAAFHPPGASLATGAGAGRGSGTRMSAFSFGGALGYALGPIAVVALVARRGLEGMWVAMLPALLLAPIAWALLPREPVRPRAAGERMALRAVLAGFAGPLGVVFAVSALGAFAQRVYLTLMPIIVSEAGGAETTGAIAISAYLAAQAMGTLFGGVMTDRMDRRRLLVGLTLWTIPANLLTYWLAPGTSAALAAAVAAGFLNMAMMPPIVVMAQEMLPARAALSAGIVMGLAWAAGSVGVIGIGVLADFVGPRSAALASVPVLLAAVALAAHPSLAPHARGRAETG